MRRIVVTGLIVFSALTLSMVGGAADQRTRGVGAALTRTPTQVEVTNFPAVQAVSGAVNVSNLPAVQTVSGAVNVANLPPVQQVAGTVNVGNLPAVQAVAGTVAVNNLPLDANGNLRIAPAVPGAPTFVLLKIADGLTVAPDLSQPIPIGTFSVAGFRRATVLARFTMESLNYQWCAYIDVRPTLDGTTFGGFGSVTGACSYTVRPRRTPIRDFSWFGPGERCRSGISG